MPHCSRGCGCPASAVVSLGITGNVQVFSCGASVMRRVLLALALLLHGCGGPTLVKQAEDKSDACYQAINASPDSKLLSARLWANDETDTPQKLSDTKPLNEHERAALLRSHQKVKECRKIIQAHNQQYASWAHVLVSEHHARNDMIFLKLISGEAPVGLANRALMEEKNRFMTAFSRGADTQNQIAAAANAESARRMGDALQQWGRNMQQQNQTVNTQCQWVGSVWSCNSR